MVQKKKFKLKTRNSQNSLEKYGIFLIRKAVFENFLQLRYTCFITTCISNYKKCINNLMKLINLSNETYLKTFNFTDGSDCTENFLKKLRFLKF